MDTLPDGLAGAVDAFVDAVNALDWELLMGLFAEDASLFLPFGRWQRAQGRAEVEAAWQEVFAQIRAGSGRDEPPYQDLESRDTHIQLFGDVAVVTFHLVNQVRHGRRTLVWRRQAEGWRIVHLHASNLPV
jgi:ketosteroid isomerase-like protein